MKLSFTGCVGCCQRDPLFCHIQNNVMCCESRGRRAAGRTTARALRGFQRDMEPTNCFFMDYLRKTTHELQGTSHLQVAPDGPQAPLMLCAPCPYNPSLEKRMDNSKGVESKHSQKASLTVGLGETTQTCASIPPMKRK